MSFALWLHELEHGVAHFPGPLPSNAGQIIAADPPAWLYPGHHVDRRKGRALRPLFRELWDHLCFEREITQAEAEALWGYRLSKALPELALRSEGAIDVSHREGATVYRLRFRVTT